mmetsp:Transcript_22896/g.35214  ORF Transcript_22896/g.35214 Transcript_22896/m.35214 type:complete len:94 (+) Transcript_22896:4270-4551(+)
MQSKNISLEQNIRFARQKATKEGESSLCAGTPMYQAPEQTMKVVTKARKENEPLRVTHKADMFAAGLILYEMCADFRTQHQRIEEFHKLKMMR